MKQQNRSPTITACKSGLVIHPPHHWLGASPDGLVNYPLSNDPEGTVECKNLHAIRAMNLMDVIEETLFGLEEGSLHLKQTHTVNSGY